MTTSYTCAALSQRKKMELFSGSILKLVAVLTMLIDHGALVFAREVDWLSMAVVLPGKSVTVYYILRRIGRLAFPLFCFLLVEGYIHTGSKKKYTRNLLVFALISEVPWNYMMAGRCVYPDVQNIYFTLFFGVVLMSILAWETPEWKKGVCLVCLYVLVQLLNVDYGFRGVVLIGLLYVLRERRAERTLFAFPLLSGGIPALCAFVPINMYNGERGFIKGKVLKYAFYIFYPLHITILLMVRWMIS